MIKQQLIPQVYHLADERNWESIQSFGLLSASQLFEQAGLNEWVSRHRAENIQLPTGVVIRDQKPMTPEALARCLVGGLKPEDWYRLLNQHVFFWVELERLDRQRKACNTPQYIMTIDAKNLLAQHASRAALTPFNTGNARRAPARRSLSSFVPYETWLNSGWESEAIGLCNKVRPLSHRPVELVIKDGVPDIMDFVINLRRLEPGEIVVQ